MSAAEIDFPGLLCARICHDLVSPVGAIGNGLELLDGAGPLDPVDLQLLTESSAAASAALGFLRLAFGAVGEGAPPVSRRELLGLAAAHLGSQRRRVEIDEAIEAAPRAQAKLACLALMLGVTATPFGGLVRLDRAETAPIRISVSAEDPRATLDDRARLLAADPEAAPETPRETHLALLAREARRRGCAVSLHVGDGLVRVDIAG